MGAVIDDNWDLSLFPPAKTDNCEICGELHIVESCTLISGFTDHVRDSPSLSYARLTLPEGLEVREMSDSTKTVIATKPFSKGLKFGPFVAKTSTLIDVRIEFPLKVFLSETESVYLETYEEIFCNWMCLVLPATSAEEQNMICFQIKGSIYFCSLRDINEGEELRVWYAPYYAEKIGACTFPKAPNLIHSSDEEFQEIFESLQSGVEMQDHQYLPKLKKRRRPPKKLVLGENYYREVPPNDVLPGELLGAGRRREWECSVCGQTELNVAAFARHLMTHYRPPRRSSLRCPICNVNFKKDGISRQVHLEVCKRKVLNKSKEGEPSEQPSDMNKTIFTVKVVNSDAIVTSDLIQEIKNGCEFGNNVWVQSNVTLEPNENGSNENDQEISQSVDIHDRNEDTNCKADTPTNINGNKSIDSANKAWIITEQPSVSGGNDTEHLRSVSMNVDVINSKEQVHNSDEILEESLLVKSHVDPPILDLSDDIEFHLTKSLDEMINDDCNLEKSLSYGKSQSLDLFESVESNLLASDVPNPHSSSLETTSFYSLEKTGFLQTDFATCNDVTDEERNRIVENLLSETDDKFFASDYEITDGCVSDNTEAQAKLGQTNKGKEVMSDNHSKKVGDFKCEICSKCFAKPFYLYRHLRKHTGEYRCNTCFQVFARKDNLLNHRLNCPNEANSQDSIRRVRITCKFCKLQFYSLPSLQEHMEKHYCNGDTWKCRCKLISNSPDLFLSHKCPFHKSLKSCTLCGKKFNSQMEFVEHKNHPIMKTGKKPNRSQLCEVCGLVFTSITGARLHRNTVHSNKTYSCSVCGETFSRPDKLQEHSHKHNNVLWECPICSKKFSSEKHCTFHQKTMHTDPSFACTFCDKKFRQKSNLKKHLRVHEDKIDCVHCKIKFSNNQQLKLHNLQNHQNLVYKCDKCKDVFATKWKLKMHKQHSHNDMYKCIYCTVECRYRSSLKRHLNASHKDKKEEWDNPQALLNMQIVNAREESQVEKTINAVSTDHNNSINNILLTAADDMIVEDNRSVNGNAEEMIVEETQGSGQIDQLTNANFVTTIMRGNMADGNSGQEVFNINVLQGSDNITQLVSVDGEVLTLPLALVSDTSSPPGLTTLDDQCSVVIRDGTVLSYPVVLPEGCVLLDDGLVAKQPSEDNSALVDVSAFQTIGGATSSAFILTDESVAESNLQLPNNVLYYVVDPSVTESIE